MLRSVPTDHDDFGFALLERTRGKKVNSLASLIRAKLQPQQPAKQDGLSDEWPVTAFDQKMVLARKVPLVSSLRALAEDYDAHVVPFQDLLAMVLTVKFDDMERHPHDAMALAVGYCEKNFAKFGISSCAIQHNPGAMLSTFRPHIHLVAFARYHSLYGWGVCHESMMDACVSGWLESWLVFKESW